MMPARKNLRLRGYDYKAPGMYFVTVCVDARKRLLGDVVSSGMAPSAAGQMVGQVWRELPLTHPAVTLDEWVVMPDHVHGILTLAASDSGVSLPQVVSRFKSFSTRLYRQGVRDHAWPECGARLWQRSFHDRVIRHDEELVAIRQYIQDNPRRWWVSHSM
jgi:putative transposase